MIAQTSRYADSYSTDVMLVDPDTGTQTRTVYRYPRPTGYVTVRDYIWRAGDRIDRIAARALRDPTRYWEIMDVNPEILNPGTIAPGTVVRIPTHG